MFLSECEYHMILRMRMRHDSQIGSVQNHLWVRSSTAVLSNLRLYVSQEHIHLDAVYQKWYYMLVLTVQDSTVLKYDCMLSSFTPLPLNDAVSVTIQWMCKCNVCTVFMWLQWCLHSWEIQCYLSLTHGVLNVRLKLSSMYSAFLKSINQIIPVCYVCVFKAASIGASRFSLSHVCIHPSTVKKHDTHSLRLYPEQRQR